MSNGPEDPKTDEPQRDLPECPECGVHKEQARRCRNFAKQVLAARLDTIGTIIAAQLALDGDVAGGLTELVGLRGLPEPLKTAPDLGSGKRARPVEPHEPARS